MTAKTKPLPNQEDIIKDITIAEYQSVFKEIERGHQFSYSLGRAYILLLGVVSSYTLYVFKKDNGIIDSKALIVYGFAGMAFCLLLFLGGLYYIKVYGRFKVLRVNYWKSIHAIRKMWRERYGLDHVLILPSDNVICRKLRPSIHPSDLTLVYILALINFSPVFIGFVFAMMVVGGFLNLDFQLDPTSHATLREQDLLFTKGVFIRTLSLYYPIICFCFAWYPTVCIRFRKELLSAECSTFSDMFASLSDRPEKTKRRRYNTVGKLILAVVLCHWFIWMLISIPWRSTANSFFSWSFLVRGWHLVPISVGIILAVLYFILFAVARTETLQNTYALRMLSLYRKNKEIDLELYLGTSKSRGWLALVHFLRFLRIC